MAVREYIGARYVPVFGRKGETSIEWDNSKDYEPLTIVLYQGTSYTSRTYVPAGIDIKNETYWAQTGNYNAQIEAYRQEVNAFDARIKATENTVNGLKLKVVTNMGELQAAVDAAPANGEIVYVPAGEYTLTGTININKNNTYLYIAGTINKSTEGVILGIHSRFNRVYAKKLMGTAGVVAVNVSSLSTATGNDRIPSNNYIEVDFIERVETCLKFDLALGGTHTNHVWGVKWMNFHYGIYIDGTTVTSDTYLPHCNENYFNGIWMSGQNDQGGLSIADQPIGVYARANNIKQDFGENSFFQCSFEGCATLIDAQNFSGNCFREFRWWEDYIPEVTTKIKFSANCKNNLFEAAHSTMPYNAISDAGELNRYNFYLREPGVVPDDYNNAIGSRAITVNGVVCVMDAPYETSRTAEAKNAPLTIPTWRNVNYLVLINETSENMLVTLPEKYSHPETFNEPLFVECGTITGATAVSAANGTRIIGGATPFTAKNPETGKWLVIFCTGVNKWHCLKLTAAD